MSLPTPAISMTKRKKSGHNLVKFTKRQTNTVRSEKIGQADVVGDECCENTHDTARFANSAKVKSELNSSTKIEINERRDACECTNSKKKEGSAKESKQYNKTNVLPE